MGSWYRLYCTPAWFILPQTAPCSAGNKPRPRPPLWRGNSFAPAPIADMGRSRLVRSTFSVICLNEDSPVGGGCFVKHPARRPWPDTSPGQGQVFLNRLVARRRLHANAWGGFPRDYSQRLLIDERLICEIVKKDLVVRPLENRHLQHQDRYQLFLRINKKGRSPDSPPREFARFS
jgi:hypothetical protein